MLRQVAGDEILAPISPTEELVMAVPCDASFDGLDPHQHVNRKIFAQRSSFLTVVVA